MAVAVGWKGYVDTDLKFSEFFNANHTVVLRFMPQFPNAFEGPFVAENGTGTFGIGQGEWQYGDDGTKLYLNIGSQFVTYLAPLVAGTWHHLAVVSQTAGTKRSFSVVLDGQPLGTPLIVSAAASNLPAGTLRFGKRTTGQTVNQHNAQYFGFLDDIAIFSRALSLAEIQNLRATVVHLSGSEPDLLAGYTFATGPLPAKLARPITLHSPATLIALSADRDNAADAAALPLPNGHRTTHLPFAPGEAWLCVKGIDTNGGHHEGYASFCWDFVLADQDHGSGGEYPHGTGGAPLYAIAGGKVVTAREDQPLGTATANLLEIEHAPGEIAGYLHLRTNSIVEAVSGSTLRGKPIALAGATGMGGCHTCNHLHIAVVDQPDGTPGFVTIPTAFSDYEVRTGADSWQRVARGIPKENEVVRNPLPTPERYTGLWEKSSVYRPSIWDWQRKDLETFAVDMQKQGYQVDTLNAFVRPDGQPYYNAVWVKSSEGRPVVWDWTRQDFDAQAAKMHAQGYELEALNPFVRADGQAYFNAVWVTSSVARPAIWDWARNDFEAHAAKMNADGYQLHALNVMTRPNGDAYNAVWVKSTEFRPAVWACPRPEFDAESARQLASGYQLHAVNMFVRNGQEFFNAIWIKSSAYRPALWSYQRRHFDASFADMQADGYQLTDLNAVLLT